MQCIQRPRMNNNHHKNWFTYCFTPKLKVVRLVFFFFVFLANLAVVHHFAVSHFLFSATIHNFIASLHHKHSPLYQPADRKRNNFDILSKSVGFWDSFCFYVFVFSILGYCSAVTTLKLFDWMLVNVHHKWFHIRFRIWF